MDLQRPIGISLLLMFIVASIGAASAATITIAAAENVLVGTTMSVDILAEGASGLQGVQFGLSYDNTMLSLVDMFEGTILSGENDPFIVDTQDDRTFVAVRMSSEPSNDEGVLASAKFLTLRAGTASITLTDTLLVSSQGTEMPVETNSAVVRIKPPVRSSSGGSGGGGWMPKTDNEGIDVKEPLATQQTIQEPFVSNEETKKGEEILVKQEAEVEIIPEHIDATQAEEDMLTGNVVEAKKSSSGALFAWIAGLIVAGIIGTGIGVMTANNKAEYQPAADYITHMRKLGYTDETSWLQLRSVGWDDNWITQAFMAAG